MLSEQRFDIYLEYGKKKVFACAIQWPGWCRSGRNEQTSKNVLLSYAPRYASILDTTGIDFEIPHTVDDFKIIARIEGNFSTDFGVPDVPIPGDAAPLSDRQIERFTEILKACWRSFDRAARYADGKQLRKGPRGGGRELAEIIDHVVQAEKSYLRRLGWTGVIPEDAVTGVALSYIHAEILSAIQVAARGEYLIQGPLGGKRWPLAYFIRRVAWHVVDHTWEIADRII